MNTREMILSKQIQWAKNRGIELIGSKGEKGRKAYTKTLDQNLFEPLEEITRYQFTKGDGNEIRGTLESPAKMQALHSSSALAVNVFQYWQKRGLANEIATACGFCNKGSRFNSKIDFERKYPIKTSYIVPPNIDVVLSSDEQENGKLFAIECKFSEAYSSMKHEGLKDKYLIENDLWLEFPNLLRLATRINPVDNDFTYLHAAQLIKHILGLHKETDGKDFKLLYLWYDALGYTGAKHREEIEIFSEYAKKDGIFFFSKSYQELIISLANDYREDHGKYVQYITERYL
jgi:hypothetical protein